MWAALALFSGVFLALATLPAPVSLVTGGFGAAIGDGLRSWFGVGAASVPLILLYWAVALFGHFDRPLAKRVTILLAGLAITVPFAGAIIYQAAGVDLRRALDDGQAAGIGLAGGFLADVLRRPLGLGGEGILALAAFSVLTIVTIGWNPLGTLRKKDAQDAPVAVADESITPAGPDTLGALAEPPGPDEAPIRPLGPPLRPGKKEPKSSMARVIGSIVPKFGGAKSAETEELPPIELLDEEAEELASFEAELDRLQKLLIETLRMFKVEARPGGRTTGPVVTQYEIIPESGVKVGRISALADDLALAIKAPSIRIVAPIPGRGAVGIEVPNPTRRSVGLRNLLESVAFNQPGMELPIALGEDLEGQAVVADLTKMPHLLIAGATGSGKSVCINTIITSLVYRLHKDHLRMLMIDPKMVELAMYKDLPHLRHAVVTDNRDAAKVFKWAVWEMQDRYELLHANGARNVVDFNRKWEAAEQAEQPLKDPKGEPYTGGRLPYVVLFVDELADLMMTVQSEIETPLALLAQKARAIGIHVVLATQRPSVNVITGLIKANFPSRIAFRVAAKVDSRTILDQNGAEALLGYGDMLFLPAGKQDPVRVQGAFISTEETEKLMAWFEERRMARIEAQREIVAAGDLEPDIIQIANQRAAQEEGGGEEGEGGTAPLDRDKLFRQAAEICVQAQGGSTSLLQRRLKIGYGRAARLIDQLEEAGVLGPSDGPRGRDVLVGLDELDRIVGE